MNRDDELNEMLATWAKADPAGAGDTVAVQRMIDHGRTIATRSSAVATERPQWWRIAGGGAIAASLVVAAIGVTMAQRQPVPQAVAVGTVSQPLQASSADPALASFALLHIPTDEEEEILL